MTPAPPGASPPGPVLLDTVASGATPAAPVPFDVPIELPATADTEELGERLAAGLAAGDLVVLAGPLGAGKTALVRGLARGLRVAGPVTSPTFVISREHRPLPDGPGVPLVHVDAYRLATAGPGTAGTPSGGGPGGSTAGDGASSPTSTSTRTSPLRSSPWSGGRAWPSGWPPATSSCAWTGARTTSGSRRCTG